MISTLGVPQTYSGNVTFYINNKIIVQHNFETNELPKSYVINIPPGNYIAAVNFKTTAPNDIDTFYFAYKNILKNIGANVMYQSYKLRLFFQDNTEFVYGVF